jgi:hypothetical protein
VSGQNKEIMRELIGRDGFPARCGEGRDQQLHPLGRRQFVPTAELQAALRGIGSIDPKRFREDIDAYIDPSPREWWDD